VVYGLGRIDASGRVADRAIVSALGWRGGDRLTLTAGAEVTVAPRDPDGVVTVPAGAALLMVERLARLSDGVARRPGIHPLPRRPAGPARWADQPPALAALRAAQADPDVRAYAHERHSAGSRPPG
jgi:hypothetical protein